MLAVPARSLHGSLGEPAMFGLKKEDCAAKNPVRINGQVRINEPDLWVTASQGVDFEDLTSSGILAAPPHDACTSLAWCLARTPGHVDTVGRASLVMPARRNLEMQPPGTKPGPHPSTKQGRCTCVWCPVCPGSQQDKALLVYLVYLRHLSVEAALTTLKQGLFRCPSLLSCRGICNLSVSSLLRLRFGPSRESFETSGW